jgi:hypothetical protein
MKVERALTADDKKHLAVYAAKCQEVKNFTIACLKGTQTGLMLFGAGGNGKTYSILETFADRKVTEVTPIEMQPVETEDDEEGEEHPRINLDDFGRNRYVSHQGRITPKGLVKMMARFPNCTHLVEDAETMFDDKTCWGVLRMGLHSQDHGLHSKRHITWHTSVSEGSYDFHFSGSLIFVGNRMPRDCPEFEAVKSRCPCLNFDISNAELIAKMKELCEQGYKKIPQATLSKNECYDVLDFILTAIEQDDTLQKDAKGQEKRLNFRIQISGFRLICLVKLGEKVDWRAMLLAQMKELVGASKRTRADRTHDENKVADEISAVKFKSQHDKLVAYCKAIGKCDKWASLPKTSAEYVKGFRAAKEHFRRHGTRTQEDTDSGK